MKRMRSLIIATYVSVALFMVVGIGILVYADSRDRSPQVFSGAFDADTLDGLDSTTFFRNDSDVENVKYHGAVGDGATDDTIAIQAAFTAVGVAGGGSVFFPYTSDYWKLTDEITVSSNTVVYSSGKPRVKQTSAAKRIFVLSGISNVRIERLQLEGLGAKDGHEGADEDLIYIYNSTDVTVEDCYLYETRGQGSIVAQESDYIRIKNCEIEKVSYTAIGIYGDCNYVWVEDNYIHTSLADTQDSGNTYGVHISVGSASDGRLYPNHVWVARNRVEDFKSWDGINAHGGQNIWITDNEVIECSFGIEVGITYYNASSTLKYVRIINNYVYGAQSDVGVSTYSSGIHVSGSESPEVLAEDVIILGNTVVETCKFKATKRAGIYMQLVDGVVISNNNVTGVNDEGIHMGTVTSNFVVSNNMVSDCNNTGLNLGFNRIFNGLVEGNHFVNTGDGYSMLYGITIGSPGSIDVVERNNTFSNLALYASGVMDYFIAERNSRRYNNTFARLGDLILDSSPTVDRTIGWLCTSRVDTEMRIQANATDTTLEVDSTTGMLAGDRIGAILDNGNVFWANVDSITDGDTLEMSAGITAGRNAPVNAAVYTARYVDATFDGSTLKFNTTVGVISPDTLDASDTKRVSVAGGGTTSASRGAYINFYGNEYATAGRKGKIEIVSGGAGNATRGDSDISFIGGHQSNPSIYIDGASGGSAYYGDGGITNYTQIAADGTITLFGTAMVEKYIVISVGELRKGGGVPDEDVIGTFPVLLFDDASTEGTYYSLHIPADWADGTDLNLAIYWCPTTDDSGKHIAWEIDWEARAHGDGAAGEIIGAGSTNVPIHDDTYTGANNMQETSYATIAGGGIAVDETIGLFIYRDHDDGDNYGQDVALIHAEVKYISDRWGE